MKNVIILIALLLGTCKICIADSKTPKLIIPKEYEVVYDANNKPYFVKSQTTLERLIKYNKPKDNSLTKAIVQTLNTTPQKCYVWDTKEVGYEYGKSSFNTNNQHLNKIVGYENKYYKGWNVYTLLNIIVIVSINFLIAVLFIFMFILALLL